MDDAERVDKTSAKLTAPSNISVADEAAVSLGERQNNGFYFSGHADTSHSIELV